MAVLKLAGCVLMAVTAAASPQLPWEVQPTPGARAQPVQYLWPEQVELAVGKPQEVDLHFRIRAGLHINSHMPSDSSFIRTELIVAEPPGIDVRRVAFPAGQPYTSKAFPGHVLSVYSGDFTLRAIVVASRPGEAMLPAALRYQACDVDSCMPPQKAPLDIDVIAR